MYNVGRTSKQAWSSLPTRSRAQRHLSTCVVNSTRRCCLAYWRWHALGLRCLALLPIVLRGAMMWWAHPSFYRGGTGTAALRSPDEL